MLRKNYLSTIFRFLLILVLLALAIHSASATVLFSTSFETGDLRDWSGTCVDAGWVDESGNPQPAPLVSSANSYSGIYSLYCPPQYHSQCVIEYISPALPTVYMQCEVYFDNLPSPANIVTFMTAMAQPNDWVNVINVAIYNDNGAVKWIMDNPPFYPDRVDHIIPAKANSGPTTGKYYCVQLGCIRSGSTIIANLWVDGQLVINYNYNGSTNDFGQFLFGAWDKNKPDGISVYLDDARISEGNIEPSPTPTPTPTPTPPTPSPTLSPTPTPTPTPTPPTPSPTLSPTPTPNADNQQLTSPIIAAVGLALVGGIYIFRKTSRRKG